MTNNNDFKELERIVREYTKGILNGQPPHGKCFMVCYPLTTYLLMCGYDVELKECIIKQGEDTYQHFYLMLDNKTVIDPTASQFTDPNGYKMPGIYIGDLPYWYNSINLKRA